MSVLHFEYHMELWYEETVSRCHFTIKCIPKEDARQRLLGLKIALSPQTSYSWGEDSFGNRQIYGRVTEPHDRFSLGVIGGVEILQTDYVEMAREERIGMFRVPYGKCVPGKGLLAYYKSLTSWLQGDSFRRCVELMHRVHQDLAYEQDVTRVGTTAEEAWALGKGVCQDYAHIYVTLLRLAGIPARYVCGLIVGEGASHAWAEALCGDRWVAFDPTNDCLVSDRHIKLGDGRDAADCAINRGIMWGGGLQRQKIAVSVKCGGDDGLHHLPIHGTGK